MKRPYAAVACGLLLAGCANLSSYWTVEGDESRKVVELIDYTQKVAGLQPEEQRRELSASNLIFLKDRGRGVYGRLRLALLLALPGTAFNDDVRAASLLEPLASGSTPATQPGPMQQLAGLLYAQVAERLREQKRTAQLKEQLDAMKDIERKIIEREQGRTK
jgi:hypothetical protein